MEWWGLFWTRIWVAILGTGEQLKVMKRYYLRGSFFKADFWLFLEYLFRSPFQISKRFLRKQGAENVYRYGETPLTSLDRICQEVGVEKGDVVYELGCGRGRTCFWLKGYLGVKRVVGIDCISEFIRSAQRVQERLGEKEIDFRCEDFVETDLSDATVVYFYGTGFETPVLKRLVEVLEKMKKGTKIVTVSYPLSDYGADFQVIKKLEISFPWGQADVYVQER